MSEIRHPNDTRELPLGIVKVKEGNPRLFNGACYTCLVWGHQGKYCNATDKQIQTHEIVFGKRGKGTWDKPPHWKGMEYDERNWDETPKSSRQRGEPAARAHYRQPRMRGGRGGNGRWNENRDSAGYVDTMGNRNPPQPWRVPYPPTRGRGSHQGRPVKRNYPERKAPYGQASGRRESPSRDRRESPSRNRRESSSRNRREGERSEQSERSDSRSHRHHSQVTSESSSHRRSHHEEPVQEKYRKKSASRSAEGTHLERIVKQRTPPRRRVEEPKERESRRRTPTRPKPVTSKMVRQPSRREQEMAESSPDVKVMDKEEQQWKKIKHKPKRYEQDALTISSGEMYRQPTQPVVDILNRARERGYKRCPVEKGPIREEPVSGRKELNIPDKTLMEETREPHMEIPVTKRPLIKSPEELLQQRIQKFVDELWRILQITNEPDRVHRMEEFYGEVNSYDTTVREAVKRELKDNIEVERIRKPPEEEMDTTKPLQEEVPIDKPRELDQLEMLRDCYESNDIARVISLLKEMPLETQDTATRLLLKDPILNQFRASPLSELIGMLGQHEGYMFMKNRKVNEELPIPAHKHGVKPDPEWKNWVHFGPGPEDPQFELTARIMEPPYPDYESEYDVMATIVTVCSTHATYRLDGAEWEAIAIRRRKENKAYMSNMGWISMYDGEMTESDKINVEQQQYDRTQPMPFELQQYLETELAKTPSQLQEEKAREIIKRIEAYKPYQPVSFHNQGYLESWIETPETEQSRTWGPQHRRGVDIRGNARLQFVKGDRVLLRIRIQKQEYDLIPDPLTGECADLAGRPRWLLPQLHARHWAKYGMFVERPQITTVMGTICGHRWRKDIQKEPNRYRVPDPRLRGSDQPEELVEVQVLLAGKGLGKFNKIWVEPGLIIPQRSTFNWDDIGLGQPCYLVIQRGRQEKVNPTSAKDDYDSNDLTETVRNNDGDIATTTVKYVNVEQHYVLSAEIGPEARKRMGHWSLPNEASAGYISEERKYSKPHYSKADHLLEAFLDVAALSGINEIEAQIEQSNNGQFNTEAQVVYAGRNVQFQLLVPSRDIVPTAYLKERLRHTQVGPNRRYQLTIMNEQKIRDSTGHMVTRFVQKPRSPLLLCNTIRTKTVYAHKDEYRSTRYWHSPTKLPRVTMGVFKIPPGANETDYIVVGTHLTLNVNKKQSRQVYSYYKEIKNNNNRQVIRFQSAVMKDTRDSLVTNVCLEEIAKHMKVKSQPKTTLEGEPMEQDEPERSSYVAIPDPDQEVEHTRKAEIMQRFLGTKTLGSEKIDESDGRKLLLDMGSKGIIELTEKQASAVRAALLLDWQTGLPRFDSMVINGPPGTGKTLTGVAIAVFTIMEGIAQCKKKGMNVGQYGWDPNREKVLLVEVFLVASGTIRATQQNAKYYVRIMKALLALKSVDSIGKKLTIWTNPQVKPILMTPIKYKYEPITEKELNEIELSYLMYEDSNAPAPVLRAREEYQNEDIHNEQIMTQRRAAQDTGDWPRDSILLAEQKISDRNIHECREALFDIVIDTIQPNVILCTIQNTQSYIMVQEIRVSFNSVIYDEAAYATMLEGISAVRLLDPQYARRMVLLGDTKQLSPFTMCKGKIAVMGCTSAMERLTDPEKMLRKLMKVVSKESLEDRQLGRMEQDEPVPRPTVVQITLSKSFRFTKVMNYPWSAIHYDGAMVSGLDEETQQQRNACMNRLPIPRQNVPLMVIGVRGEEEKRGNSRVNKAQCNEGLSIATMIVKAQAFSHHDITMITPYEGNRLYIKEALRILYGAENELQVLNADSAQGNEYRCVIWIGGRSAPTKILQDLRKTHGEVKAALVNEMVTNEEIDPHLEHFPGYDHEEIGERTTIALTGFLNDEGRGLVGKTRASHCLIIIDDPMTTDVIYESYVLTRWAIANGVFMPSGVEMMMQYMHLHPDHWRDKEGYLRPIEDVKIDTELVPGIPTNIPTFGDKFASSCAKPDLPEMYTSNIDAHVRQIPKDVVQIGRKKGMFIPIAECFSGKDMTRPLKGQIRVYSEEAWQYYVNTPVSMHKASPPQLDDFAVKAELTSNVGYIMVPQLATQVKKELDGKLHLMSQKVPRKIVEQERVERTKREELEERPFAMSEAECMISDGPDERCWFEAPSHKEITYKEIRDRGLHKLQCNWQEFDPSDVRKIPFPAPLKRLFDSDPSGETLNNNDAKFAQALCDSKTVKPEAIETLLDQAIRDICASRRKGIRENDPTEYLRHCLRYEWLRFTVKRKENEEFTVMWNRHLRAKELAYMEDGRIKASAKEARELGQLQKSMGGMYMKPGPAPTLLEKESEPVETQQQPEEQQKKEGPETATIHTPSEEKKEEEQEEEHQDE